jgi:GT2 family glycosyltransferase
MKIEKKVNILILNYNCWKDTIDCLLSILENDYKNYHVYIMDNKSTDDSNIQIEKSLSTIENILVDQIGDFRNEYIFSNAQKISFIKFPENYGFAGANNIIIEEIIEKEEYVWLFNPDMIMKKDTLVNLINCAESSDPLTVWGILTNDINNPDTTTIPGGAKVNPFLGTVSMKTNEIDYINGNALFCNLKVFKKYGILNSEFFLYWEETDWGYSIKKQGGVLKVCKDAVAFDKGGTSIGRGFIADYYYTRNGLYFVNKHFTIFHTFTSIIFCFVRIAHRLFKGQSLRAKGVFYGMLAFIVGKKGKF